MGEEYVHKLGQGRGSMGVYVQKFGGVGTVVGWNKLRTLPCVYLTPTFAFQIYLHWPASVRVGLPGWNETSQLGFARLFYHKKASCNTYS